MYAKLAATILVCALLSACSDPKDAKLPADISKWSDDAQLAESVKKLPEEEKKLFLGYATRRAIASAFGGSQAVTDTTVGEALKTQKAWLDEKAAEEVKQKALAEQVKQQQLQSLKEMNATLTASLIELELSPKDYAQKRYSDYFSIRVAFKNNTTDALSGIKGTVVLKDIFGDVIKRITLSDDSQIDPGQNYIYNGTMDYNQFQASDKKLASANFAKMQFEWEPDTYVFASGKKQVMPH
ncbi:hypothetical protein [Pseudomonas fluorescens]|uniref:Lipoprotein n=1 Tax=Pseudomonas fluorescens TaxID=294 RepID=A0A5E7IGL0_PSEFL|nr:hypothetical protein [Pseudomonas fluorescens]VVO75066.1 hypothetical protein PS854_01501 [Pseudomonas fluorescens]